MWDLDSIKHLYKQENEYRELVKIINKSGLTPEIEKAMTDIAIKVGYDGDLYDVKKFKNFLLQKLQNTLNSLSLGG
jgi:hypothetical protein